MRTSREESVPETCHAVRSLLGHPWELLDTSLKAKLKRFCQTPEFHYLLNVKGG